MVKPEDCGLLTDDELKRLKLLEKGIDEKLRYHDFASMPFCFVDLNNPMTSFKLRTRAALLYEEHWDVDTSQTNGLKFKPRTDPDWKALARQQLGLGVATAEAADALEEEAPVRAYDFEE